MNEGPGDLGRDVWGETGSRPSKPGKTWLCLGFEGLINVALLSLPP